MHARMKNVSQQNNNDTINNNIQKLPSSQRTHYWIKKEVIN